MKTINKLLILLFILTIPFVVLFFKPHQETFEIYYDIYMDEKGGGINTDNDKVYFGTHNVNREQHAWRPFNLTNNDLENSYNVEIFVDGPMKNNIWVSENPITLNPGENNQLRIHFKSSPGEFEVGHYEGLVKAVYTQIR